MIPISRSRTDERGRIIQPQNGWFRKAAKATKDAIKEGKEHELKRDVYADDHMRAALRELFHDKCAYCEIRLPEADWPIDHFRPFGRVHEDPEHPGYYWLAYEWTNLYPACTMCNGPRKEKPSWDNPQGGPTGGKWDQFPLADQNSRVRTPGEVSGEKRLLLDPCHDDPSQHLDYSLDGKILVRDQSLMGETTKSILRLNRRFIKNERKKVIATTIFLLQLIRDLERGGKRGKARSARYKLQKFSTGDDLHFAGAAKAVERDPTRFGL